MFCLYSFLNSKMVQIGGSYIDEGAGGCVFRPYISCTDKVHIDNSKDTVGKIFDDHQYEGELKYFQLIKKYIDPKSEFTVDLLGTCKTDDKQFKPSDEKHKCSKYSRDFDQIIYEYGGKNLRKVLLSRDILMDDIVPHMRMLFKGIVTINKANFLHFDIKLDNILFEQRTNKFNIVDFGLMRRVDRVYTPNFVPKANFDYPWYCPEHKMWFLLQTIGMRSYEYALHLFERNFSIVKLSDIFKHFPEQETHFKAFYNLCKKTPEKAIEVIEKNAIKTDVYSLGMVLYHMLRYFAKTDLYYDGILMRELFSLSAQMMCFDPRKRLTAQQSLKAFDKILQQ